MPPQQQQQRDEGTILPDYTAPHNIPVNNNTVSRSKTDSYVEPVLEMPRPNNIVEYREKIQALHACM